MSKAPTLLQFWDSNPPDYIQTLLDTVSSNHPELNYQLFDDRQAREYIEKHFGSSYKSLYDSCAIPAMRSDFFRYCYLYHQGGFYVDADFESLRSISEVLSRNTTGCLYEHNNGITNSMLYVQKANDPLLEKVLALAVKNIQEKNSESVWGVTGPVVFRRLRADQKHAALFNDYQVIGDSEFERYFRLVPGLAYKKSDVHWTVARDKGISIFNV